jgi:transposase InsO family protein
MSDSESSSSSLGFKQLDDTNYPIWLLRMTNALKRRMYYEYATGTEPKPQADPTVTYPETPEGKAAKVKAEKALEKELREYTKKDGAAAALIIAGISDSQLHHVKDCTTASETWTKIRAAHEKKGGLQQALLHFSTIVNTRMAESSKVQDHINIIRTAHEQLIANNAKMHFTESLLAAALMNSFPPSYDVVKMSLGQLKEDDFTVAAVSSAMLNEEQRRITASTAFPSPSGTSDYSALIAHRPQLQQQPPTDRSLMTCNWCGLPRHLENECHRKSRGEPQRSAAEKQAARKQSSQRRHGRGRPASSTREANLAEAEEKNLFLVLPCTEEDDPASPVTESPSQCMRATTAPKESTPSQSVTLHSHGVKSVGAPDSDWYVDSAATYHYCRHRDWFDSFTPLEGESVSLGDGRRVPILGQGDISARVPISATGSAEGLLSNVQYVPDLTANLLSVPAMTAVGLSVTFQGRLCIIRNKSKKIIGRAVRVANKLYQLTLTRQPRPSPVVTASAPRQALTASQSTDFIQQWHHRLGHVNHETVRQVFTQHMGKDTDSILSGRSLSPTHSNNPPPACNACHLGKSHRASLPKVSTSHSKAPLELVHTDICGPFRIPSFGGARYFILFIDDYSRYVWVRPLGRRSEAIAAFKIYKAQAELLHSQAGHRIKQVRFDGAGEFSSGEFRAYLESVGIRAQQTSADTSSQNGVAERMIRTVAESARAMMMHWTPHMPSALWAEAVSTAVYLRNRCLTRALKGMTPYEAWFGVKPSYKYLRTFGCLVYAHLTKQAREAYHKLGKLGAKAVRCVFIGYSLVIRGGYRLWDPVGQKVITTLHASFEEHEPGYTASQSAPVPSSPQAFDDILPWIPVPEAEDKQPEPESETNVESEDSVPELIPAPASVPATAPADPAVPPSAPSAPSRSIAPPSGAAAPAQSQAPAKPSRELRRLQDTLTSGSKDNAPSTVNLQQPQAMQASASSSTEPATWSAASAPDPSTYEEAMGRPDAPMWRAAMQAEIDSLRAAGTYDVVPLPHGRSAIGGKWVYRTKRNAAGDIVKYKARWVAQGFSQKFGIDYNETFAPVARFDSIRAILAMVAHHDWELHQMDVKSAYLNGDLDEEIYMHQPIGFVIGDCGGLACRLNKSLYGLKQAGRTWNKRIDSALRSLHFQPIHADPCVYAYRRESVILIISLYVDDLLLASSSLVELNKVKAELSSCFEMEDLGEARFILGIQITRDCAARTLTICQSAYTLDVLKRFNMQDCEPVSTPMTLDKLFPSAKAGDAPATGQQSADVQLDEAGTKRYQSAVGSLMYASQATRPDITYAVTALSQFCSKPTEEHWRAVKRVLRYLRGTMHYGLTYRGPTSPNEPPSLTLRGYCDSDWAEDSIDRRSITGYAFLLSGAPISWASRKQSTVAHSSTEAEYMAVSDAAKEAVWWRSFLSSLGFNQSNATTILSDNQGSIKLSKNPENHRRTKHIDVRYHYIRECVSEGTVLLDYISTKEMAADVLTKPLGRLQHATTIKLLGMHIPTSPPSLLPSRASG